MSSIRSIKGGRDKAKSSKFISRSQKANFQFHFGHIAHFFKARKYVDCVGIGAPVYLFVILEYLTVEVLELARNATKANVKNRIIPGHIQLAIRIDEELSKLLRTVTIANEDF